MLGGVKAVSPTVEQQLGAYAPTSRAAGVDRYQTASALAATTQYQGSVDTVFVANGLTLADGLTGGAAAGLVGAPMLTTNSAGLDDWTAAEIKVLNPKHIVILGGPAVVTQGAVNVMAQLFSATSYRTYAAVVSGDNPPPTTAPAPVVPTTPSTPVSGTRSPSPTTPTGPGTPTAPSPSQSDATPSSGTTPSELPSGLPSGAVNGG